MVNRTIALCFLYAVSIFLAGEASGAAPGLTAFQHQGGVDSEYVTLSHSGKKRIALTGWTLSSAGGASYTFPKLKLKKRQTVTVHSAVGTDNLKGRAKALFVGSSGEFWPDAGGTLVLKNKRGKTVLTRSYGDQVPPFEKTVFFIHHSTGQIYWNGGLRAALEANGYTGAAPWWDGGTDPGDFYGLFTDAASWNIIGDRGIIIFKSCFPASNIESGEMLEQYKSWYRQLYEVFSLYPDRLFVPLSTPPLLEDHTTAANAARALEFEAWLMGDFVAGYQGRNLAPFALHTLLSDSHGYLAQQFIASPDDDHPNDYSGEVVGSAIAHHLETVLGYAQ